MVFITVLSVVTDVGFSLYLVHVERLTQVIISTAFYVAAATGLVLGGALALTAAPLAAAFDVDELRLMLPVLAVSVVLTGIASVPAALLTREMQFRQIAVRQVSSTVVSVVVAIALALAGAGAWALVAQTVVRSVVSSAVLFRVAPFRLSRELSWLEARRITTFGTKTVGVRLVGQLRNESEALVLGGLVGTVALGLWAVAGRLVRVVADLFGSVVGAVASPVFARLQDDPQRLAWVLSRSQATAAFVMVPAMTGLALTAQEVVPLVFGEQWAPAVDVAAILAIYVLVLMLGGFSGSVLQATGRPGLDLAAVTGLTTVHVALVLVFATRGLEQLALAITVEVVATSWVRPYLLRRALGVPWRTYAPTVAVLLSGGLATGAVLAVVLPYELDGAALLVSVALIGGTVYLLAVWFLARDVLTEVARSVKGLVRRHG